MLGHDEDTTDADCAGPVDGIRRRWEGRYDTVPALPPA
ncbi:hypothetical protein S1361_36855 [Streptomyces cyanogenus]|uniref:Uncharacterized protein n=1 Tax=Streptomyces cyanogenus TaxID=80860 RepID=A0ABX7U1Q7_STRCY|nr:hypothetical protein S1361_36855 [Streptomyces cyanogenus]